MQWNRRNFLGHICQFSIQNRQELFISCAEVYSYICTVDCNCHKHLKVFRKQGNHQGLFFLPASKNPQNKTTWSTRASHFVDGWHLPRCQICFFPYPLSGWPLDFCMDDLVWERFFFPKPLELEVFSPTYNGVRFFFSALFLDCTWRHQKSN